MRPPKAMLDTSEASLTNFLQRGFYPKKSPVRKAPPKRAPPKKATLKKASPKRAITKWAIASKNSPSKRTFAFDSSLADISKAE